MKKSLVVVAHGSRRKESNEELITIAKKLSASTASGFSDVYYGFLELAEPSIPDAITQCINSGAQSVTVLPYFLSAGRHVTVDIPNEVLKVQQLHPECSIVITSYLGAADDLIDVIANIALTNSSKPDSL
ncbi:Sirohydrochlorin cobaltochelatase [hydrothermal vent metagenome]|uniref:Sirohydrochlorin cobaltochelatase n=1 Tax=hydrothermal vent metagenome TaxID=652676 RepID=A0A3B1A4U8_9ZZZZ